MKGLLEIGLVLLVLTLSSCGSPSSSVAQDGVLRLVVFVEATNDSDLNEEISQKYLKPLYQRLTSVERPFDITIYPISANTEGETALLRFAHREEWLTETDVENLADAFRELRQRYAQVYPSGSSYLVDVLGTAVLLDSALEAGGGGHTEVLYLSDMIQQDDINGYDFTEYARGKSLDQARSELQEKLGVNIRHRDLFRNSRIHIVYLGLDGMRRGRSGVPDSGPTTRNMEEIKTFWEKEFFRDFLGAEVVPYSGTVDQALDKIFSPR